MQAWVAGNPCSRCSQQMPKEQGSWPCQAEAGWQAHAPLACPLRLRLPALRGALAAAAAAPPPRSPHSQLQQQRQVPAPPPPARAPQGLLPAQHAAAAAAGLPTALQPPQAPQHPGRQLRRLAAGALRQQYKCGISKPQQGSSTILRPAQKQMPFQQARFRQALGQQEWQRSARSTCTQQAALGQLGGKKKKKACFPTPSCCSITPLLAAKGEGMAAEASSAGTARGTSGAPRASMAPAHGGQWPSGPAKMAAPCRAGSK